MNYDIKRTTQFKKDVKLMLKQGRDIRALLDVVEMLRTDTPLPEKCRDHALSGHWAGKRVISTPTGCWSTKSAGRSCC